MWLPGSGIRVGRPGLPGAGVPDPTFFCFAGRWRPRTPPPEAWTCRHRPQLCVSRSRDPRLLGPFFSFLPRRPSLWPEAVALSFGGMALGKRERESDPAPDLALFRRSTKRPARHLSTARNPLSFIRSFLEGACPVLSYRNPAPWFSGLQVKESSCLSLPLARPLNGHLEGIKREGKEECSQYRSG